MNKPLELIVWVIVMVIAVGLLLTFWRAFMWAIAIVAALGLLFAIACPIIVLLFELFEPNNRRK
jgi:hypothetical protein